MNRPVLPLTRFPDTFHCSSQTHTHAHSYRHPQVFIYPTQKPRKRAPLEAGSGVVHPGGDAAGGERRRRGLPLGDEQLGGIPVRAVVVHRGWVGNCDGLSLLRRFRSHFKRIANGANAGKEGRRRVVRCTTRAASTEKLL